MRVQKFSLASACLAVAAVVGLAACDKKPEDRTVGQQIDSAVAKVEQKTDSTMAKAQQKTDQAMAEVKKDVNAAAVAGGKALDSASVKLKDAAITTSINAELAKDANLSALKINVDTTSGRVALKGTAPDAAARDRATQLAQRVDGVVGVDNQLVVRSN